MGYLAAVKAQVKHALRVHEGEVRVWPPGENYFWICVASREFYHSLPEKVMQCPVVATILETSGDHVQTKTGRTQDDRAREAHEKPLKRWDKRFAHLPFLDRFSAEFEYDSQCYPDIDNAISGIAVHSCLSRRYIFMRKVPCITLAALFAYEGKTRSFADLYTQWACSRIIIKARNNRWTAGSKRQR